LGSSDRGERFIVPKSSRWVEEPLRDPSAYRRYAELNGDSTGADLLKLTNEYGFLLRPQAKEEDIAEVCEQIRQLKEVVEAIERRDWKRLKVGFRGDAMLERPESLDGLPQFEIRPRDLATALRLQAVLDASLGAKHRKCKNPECDRYFPIEGPNAYRKGAEYHDPACQRRHYYRKGRGEKP
jgi:hypothetical protein